MTDAFPSLGSLEAPLKQIEGAQGIFMPAGPVSDAFIMSNGPTDLINGPVGSGKTTATIKRALRAAVEQPPILATGVRRYVVTFYRETYEQLWKTTIPSYQRTLDPKLGTWTGASPRSAQHVIGWEDAWGKIEFVARFVAFGDDADPDDLGGMETTDACLGEMNTLREDLFINLAGRVGRDPPRGAIGIPDLAGMPYGRIFGDCNAPSPEDWVFRDFWSPVKPPSYRLFRQPGGLDPAAENIAVVGRSYYLNQIERNLHRPWWINIKIHNKPGFNREMDIVFEKFDDDRMVSMEELRAFRELPVVLGFDGGFTPAAAFMQHMPGGQMRVLAEVTIGHGDENDLARGCREVMAQPRFAGCEFTGIADPAMKAGDETTNGSMMGRLAKLLGIRIKAAVSNDPETRHKPVRDAIERNVSGGLPGFLIDGRHCPSIRRGLNGTFHYRSTRGTKDRSGVVKTRDSHVCEAAEYASLASGTALARQRQGERDRARRDRLRQSDNAAPYNPLDWRSAS